MAQAVFLSHCSHPMRLIAEPSVRVRPSSYEGRSFSRSVSVSSAQRSLKSLTNELTFLLLFHGQERRHSSQPYTLPPMELLSASVKVPWNSIVR